MNDGLVHLRIKVKQAGVPKISLKTACGLEATGTTHTLFDDLVTCPNCREWYLETVTALESITKQKEAASNHPAA